MGDNIYETFVDCLNALTLATQDPVRPIEKKDFSLAELGDLLTQMERDMREKKRQEEEEKKEKWLRTWEDEEEEEKNACSAMGVYIVYNGLRVYTYQDVIGGSRIVISIRGRQHLACTECDDSSVKLREGRCKACDV